MTAAATPSLWVVAGANGVGKTTFARAEIAALSGSDRFVNLDLIASGLSPFNPQAEQVRAARVAIELIEDNIAEKRTFALETTLAGRMHRSTLSRARAAGYRVELLYFYVSSVEEALARIAKRVAEGGHDVPAADARRRYERSLANFESYARLSDHWRIYSADRETPRLKAEGAQHALLMRSSDADKMPATLQVVLGWPGAPS